MSDTQSKIPAPVVATAGWFVPGLGYWLIGQRARAVAVFITVLALFVMGLWIAGVRVIDVPGYAENGQRVLVAPARDSSGAIGEVRSNQPGVRWEMTAPESRRWALAAHPISEVLNKPWYIGQILAGPITLICSKYSLDLSQPTSASQPNASEPTSAGQPSASQPTSAGPPGASKAHVRVAEIGTLYTAVAGMLNLLVIIDAAHRATRKETT